ncbi:MAG: 3-dehydroquinate synthase [Proteobacteria bacterium]|nr:MAG: 3-dehydroquinate synthase [Pseudomonadota bacterium]
MTVSEIQVALGAGRGYPIRFVPGLPGPAVAAAARERVPGARRALLVTDSNVGPLYAAGVVASLQGASLATEVFELAAGEASKSLTTIGAAVDRALSARLLRGDLVVALGGGVVGDIAGFSAAILHRGVAFIQAPTSLLAQVDSAVGGKTGVNHAAGKNLIGAFWQPRAVISSAEVLQTLPAREVRCGLAEALKHGYLADAALVARSLARVDALRRLEAEPVAELVADCCRIKAAVVAADERDHGQRVLLNLGHTFGHAYERLVGYGALTHGEAVALGMVWAARLSEREGLAAAGLEAEVAGALAAFGLPHDVAAPDLPGVDALIEAALTDKKADAGGVRFVLLEGVGRGVTRRLSWDRVRALLGAADD